MSSYLHGTFNIVLKNNVQIRLNWINLGNRFKILIIVSRKTKSKGFADSKMSSNEEIIARPQSETVDAWSWHNGHVL